MRLLRATWARWFAAVLLLGSLLPLVAAAPAGLAGRAAGSSYGGWLRLQVRGAAPAAFESALADAERSGARSQRQFLRAFVDAYESLAPAEPLSALFSGQRLTGEGLVELLAGRMLLSVAGGFPDEYLLTSAPIPTLLPVRAWQALPAAARAFGRAGGGLAAELPDLARLPVRAARLLSAALPLGP